MSRARILSVLMACVVAGSMFVGPVATQQPEKDNNTEPPIVKGKLCVVAVSADGKLAMAGDSERNIWIWDIGKRELVRAIRGAIGGSGRVPSYSFSGDGSLALVGSHGVPGSDSDPETLVLWDVRKGERIRSLDCKGEPVYGVGLSQDGKLALSFSLCKTILPPGADPSAVKWRHIANAYALRLWDVASGKRMRSVLDEETKTAVFWAPFSPDGRQIAAGCSPIKTIGQLARERAGMQALSIWKIGEEKAWSSVEVPAAALGSAAFSPDGKFLAVGHNSGLCLVDLSMGGALWRRDAAALLGGNAGERPVSSVAFSPDGKRIAVASRPEGYVHGPPAGATGGLVVIETDTGKKPVGFRAAKGWVASVSYTPNGKMLLGVCTGGVRFWNADTGEEEFTLKRR